MHVKTPAVNWLLPFAISLALGSCASQMTEDTTIYGSWTLVSFGNEPNKIAIGDAKAKFSLNLTEDGTAHGIVACNGWRGKFQYENEKLSIPRALSTRKYCIVDEPDLKALESRYLSGLKEAAVTSMNASSLTLSTNNNETWMFERLIP